MHIGDTDSVNRENINKNKEQKKNHVFLLPEDDQHRGQRRERKCGVWRVPRHDLWPDRGILKWQTPVLLISFLTFIHNYKSSWILGERWRNWRSLQDVWSRQLRYDQLQWNQVSSRWNTQTSTWLIFFVHKARDQQLRPQDHRRPDKRHDQGLSRDHLNCLISLFFLDSWQRRWRGCELPGVHATDAEIKYNKKNCLKYVQLSYTFLFLVIKCKSVSAFYKRYFLI